jgi:hypothetical protein
MPTPLAISVYRRILEVAMSDKEPSVFTQVFRGIGVLALMPIAGVAFVGHLVKRRLIDGDTADEAGQYVGTNNKAFEIAIDVGAGLGDAASHVVGYVAKEVADEVAKDLAKDMLSPKK